MKRIIFISSILLSSIAFAFAQGPQIHIPKSTHNFGTIKEDAGPVSYSFDIQNRGDEPLIITRVSTSCGCTASEWTKEPILPGSSSIIKATYNPLNRPGAFNQSITVYTNASNSGSVLIMRGNVEPREKTPEDIYKRRMGDLGFANSHLSFGKVTQAEKAEGGLDVYNFGSEPITLSFERVPSYITLETKPNTIEPGEKGQIGVVFDATKVDDWGFVINRVTVQVNGQNPQGNLMSISANIEEDFSKLSEKELEKAASVSFDEIIHDFGIVDEGTVIKHDFKFTNTGKSDLIIRKISASCGCTTIAPSKTVIKPGESSSLTASFRTQGYSGRQSKTITVITNDPQKSSIVLRLTGTVSKK